MFPLKLILLATFATNLVAGISEGASNNTSIFHAMPLEVGNMILGLLPLKERDRMIGTFPIFKYLDLNYTLSASQIKELEEWIENKEFNELSKKHWIKTMDERFNVSLDYALLSSCHLNIGKVAEFLLKDKRVDPNVGVDVKGVRRLPIIDASSAGNAEIVELLLKYGADPSAYDNNAIGIASRKGHSKVVELLLNDSRVNPSALGNLPFKLACMHGHDKVVELLLNDARVDPSAGDNFAIRIASENGLDKVVRLLLNDRRVDPSAEDNYAIRVASENGLDKVVKLLLGDGRVDPSNLALKSACRNGHVQVVLLLLNDSRVDPFANENEAIKIASEKGHDKVVELLLNDSRFHKSALENLPVSLAAKHTGSKVVKYRFNAHIR